MTSDSKKAIFYAFAEFFFSEQNKWIIYSKPFPTN